MPFVYWKPLKGSFTNSRDPDKLQHYGKSTHTTETIELAIQILLGVLLYCRIIVSVGGKRGRGLNLSNIIVQLYREEKFFMLALSLLKLGTHFL